MSSPWTGVFPAAVTCFHSDESLDFAATTAHVLRMIDAGVHGMVMLGTVGENCSLRREEKLSVLRATVEAVGGRTPILTGVAEYTTAQAAQLARDAHSAGVDGLMVLPAMVYKSDPRGTISHFRAVASATDLLIMLYNNPVSYGVDIRPEMFGSLADLPNVVAIKESSEDPRRITDLRNRYGDRFTLFAGVDDLALESVMLGADGWVSGLVNAFPDEHRRLWDLAIQGDFFKARDLYRWYTPLLHLDTHPKLAQYIKLAMALREFGSEMVRAPRLPLEGEERQRIVELIRQSLETRPQR